jgi:beta-phosphoglucomutase
VYDEVPAILDFLKSKQVRIGLVTGASRNRIEATLEQKLKSYFDIIVTSDEVKNGKPHPEPYLKAITKLGCNPTNTIVVENAKLGIRSAKSAGCFCLAIETTLGREFLIEADAVFSDHQHILNHFINVNNNYEYSKN